MPSRGAVVNLVAQTPTELFGGEPIEEFYIESLLTSPADGITVVVMNKNGPHIHGAEGAAVLFPGKSLSFAASSLDNRIVSIVATNQHASNPAPIVWTVTKA